MELHLRIIEAKDLAKMDTIGLSDPYVKIKIFGSTQTAKTSVKKNTLTPVWNEEFHFACHNPNKQNLRLKMYDEDVAADDEMAILQIPLASIEPSHVKDQWFEMTPVKGVKKGGFIHIVYQLNYFGCPAFREIPPITGPGPYVLNLHLIEAKDVPKMDVTSSDPFIRMEFEGNKNCTQVIKKCLNPKWDQTFQFDIQDLKTAVLYLTLWDKDLVQDDEISTLEFGVSYLPYGKVVNEWFTMENIKGNKKKGGVLHMAIQVAQKGSTPFQ